MLSLWKNNWQEVLRLSGLPLSSEEWQACLCPNHEIFLKNAEDAGFEVEIYDDIADFQSIPETGKYKSINERGSL